MNRAEFLQWMSVTGAGLVAPKLTRGGEAATAASGTLPERRLGASGASLPILGVGGSHLGLASSERDAQALIETAIAEGVRLLDNAESYHDGKSERWMGAAIRALGARSRVFLMTKTFDLRARSRESAQRHLEGSLERLGTDYLDLWQLHSVRTVPDVDHAFRRGGAMEYIVEMKERGVVRHIGVTGHQNPAANLRALHYWDQGIRFDAMQMPLNPMDYHQHSFQRRVLPELVKRDIGVIAMKTSADGRLLREQICTIEECLAYVWSLPVSVAVVGMERAGLVRANAAQARSFRPLSDMARNALLDRIAPRAELSLEWYKRAGE